MRVPMLRITALSLAAAIIASFIAVVLMTLSYHILMWARGSVTLPPGTWSAPLVFILGVLYSLFFAFPTFFIGGSGGFAYLALWFLTMVLYGVCLSRNRRFVSLRYVMLAALLGSVTALPLLRKVAMWDSTGGWGEAIALLSGLVAGLLFLREFVRR